MGQVSSCKNYQQQYQDQLAKNEELSNQLQTCNDIYTTCTTENATCQANLVTANETNANLTNELNTCNTSLDTCNTALGTSDSNLQQCNINLQTTTDENQMLNDYLVDCQQSNTTITENLEGCQQDLEGCQQGLETCNLNSATCLNNSQIMKSSFLKWPDTAPTAPTWTTSTSVDLTPELTYPQNYVYKVQPPLPAGLNIDPNNGRIYGTPTVTAPQTDYTVCYVPTMDDCNSDTAVQKLNFTFEVQ